MPGVYDWTTSSLYSVGSSLYSAAYKVTAATCSVAIDATVKSCTIAYRTMALTAEMLTPPAVTSWASDSFGQAWPGLMHVFDCLRVVPKVIKTKTRHVLAHSFYDNVVLQAGGVLASKMILRQAVQYIPDPTAAYATEATLDTAINAYFTTRVIPNAINNWLYMSNVYRAAYDENINDGSFATDKQPGFQDIQAMLASPIYQTSKLVSVQVISTLADYLFKTGKLVEYPLKALVYGQNINEAKLAARWISTEERNRELSKNNWHSFAAGAVFLGSFSAMSYGIEQTTGVNSWLIDAAIFSFWYQYNMVALLLNKEPLPGKRDGIDFFYYNRYLTEKLIKDGFDFTVKMFRDTLECDLVVMPVMPSKDKIDFNKTFPGKSNTAYVLVNDKLYFVNKDQRYLMDVESVSATTIKRLKQALNVPFVYSSDKAKCLNGDVPLTPQMLQYITLLTDFKHPDAPHNWLETFAWAIDHQIDCDLVFSNYTPTKDNLHLLTGKSKTAFVVVQDRFYYVDKTKNEVTRDDNVNKDQIDKIKIALNISVSETFERPVCFGNQSITLDTLRVIMLATGCSHPDDLKWMKLVDELNQSKPVKLTKKMFLRKELRSFDAFMKSKVMSMYMNLQAASINTTCEILMRIRNEPLVKAVTILPVPDTVMNQETKKYMHALLGRWLDGVLEEISRYVYIKRANQSKITDVDEAKKHLKKMLDKIETTAFELNGGGVSVNGKDYSRSVFNVKQFIENALGDNAPIFTREVYNKALKDIRDELFDKTFETAGFYIFGGRKGPTVQLYKELLLMCIDLDAPKPVIQQDPVANAPAAVVAPAASVSAPVSVPAQTYPSLEEIKRMNSERAKQHLQAMYAELRKGNYEVGAGGRSFPGETKRYPNTIYSILELLIGVMKPTAHFLTIKIHNDTISEIKRMLLDILHRRRHGISAVMRDGKTEQIYREIIGKWCHHLPDQAPQSIAAATAAAAPAAPPVAPRVVVPSPAADTAAAVAPSGMPRVYEEYGGDSEENAAGVGSFSRSASAENVSGLSMFASPAAPPTNDPLSSAAAATLRQ